MTLFAIGVLLGIVLGSAWGRYARRSTLRVLQHLKSCERGATMLELRRATGLPLGGLYTIVDELERRQLVYTHHEPGGTERGGAPVQCAYFDRGWPA